MSKWLVAVSVFLDGRPTDYFLVVVIIRGVDVERFICLLGIGSGVMLNFCGFTITT